MKNSVYISLGSNLGAREANIRQAISHIEKQVGTLLKSSPIYLTAAWGKTDQPDFLNQLIIVESELEPEDCMETLLKIEATLGRNREVEERWGPRSIDLDILFFGSMVVETPSLQIPHPRLRERRFVLVPLSEISPDFNHPLLNTSLKELLVLCPDKTEVKSFDGEL